MCNTPLNAPGVDLGSFSHPPATQIAPDPSKPPKRALATHFGPILRLVGGLICGLGLLASAVQAQTNNPPGTNGLVHPTYYASDFGMVPQAVAKVTQTPLVPIGDYNGAILVPNPRVIQPQWLAL
jgi:hypothetical protein